MTKQVDAASVDSQMLIRTGNAIWASRQVDRETIDAMAEGRGVWARTSNKMIFQVLGTTTPPAYLNAIAVTESGVKGRFWPWTINYLGRAYYFDSKEQAISAAIDLIAKGVSLFDVGMMQVNWRLHQRRFTSIESAFDPEENIRAADVIVQEHMQSTGSMSEALGRYHSKTPSRKSSYLRKINTKLNTATIPTNPKGNLSC